MSELETALQTAAETGQAVKVDVAGTVYTCRPDGSCTWGTALPAYTRRTDSVEFGAQAANHRRREGARRRAY